MTKYIAIAVTLLLFNAAYGEYRYRKDKAEYAANAAVWTNWVQAADKAIADEVAKQLAEPK
jgi:hypothetical protein